MSHTVYFVWTHGGHSVNLAGSFNKWTTIPLVKQGNYFFATIHLSDGVYQYKYVVDGSWHYDLGQPHEDDGSGNWNNYIEIGSAAQHHEHSPVVTQHHAAVVKHETHAQQQHQQHQPQHQQEHPGEEQHLSKNQQKKLLKQQDKAAKKAAKAKQHEEEVHQHEEEVHQHEEEGHQHEAETEVDHAPATPAKTLHTVVVIDVATSDVDTDVLQLEAFVRSVQRDGLKWEGSSVSDYVFGLKKITIACKVDDDVSVEEVCQELEKNTGLVGSAQIQSFCC